MDTFSCSLSCTLMTIIDCVLVPLASYLETIHWMVVALSAIYQQQFLKLYTKDVWKMVHIALTDL